MCNEVSDVPDGRMLVLITRIVSVQVQVTCDTTGRHQHHPTCRTGSSAAGAKVVVKVRKRQIQLEWNAIMWGRAALSSTIRTALCSTSTGSLNCSRLGAPAGRSQLPVSHLVGEDPGIMPATAAGCSSWQGPPSLPLPLPLISTCSHAGAG